MTDFNQRSYKKELLDKEDIPFGDIQKNMRELNLINKFLGGHIITLKGLKKIIENKSRSIVICEIGCGGGDNLYAIHTWAKKNKIDINLIGIDIKKECIKFAKESLPANKFNFICSDYKEVKFDNPPDIIFSSLFCHHFTNEEIIDMLVWMKQNSAMGFFINDLHRHIIAYHFIRLATKLFSKSYLVKNDAPLSVLRGFKKSEWKKLLQDASLNNYAVEWCWAFRYLITYQNESA